MAKLSQKKKKKLFKPSPEKRLLEGMPSWFTNRKLHCLVLFVWSFILYANTIGHDYTQDDAIVITENTFTKKGVNGLSGIFGNDTFYGFFNDPGKANLVAGGRYRPLTLFMFAIEYQLFGLNPAIGHLINVLMFGLTTVLLYLLSLKLISPQKDKAMAYAIAFLGSFLFAAHPIHTEVVANIKGRDEIAALMFSLAAVYFSLIGYRRGKPFWSAIAAIVFFLGLLSKENTITFVAVVPLIYYFFTNASLKRIAIQTTPLIMSAFLFLFIRATILDVSLDEPTSIELMNNPFLKWNGTTYEAFSFSEKMATVIFTWGKYIQLLFFPHPLSHDYYPKQIPMLNWANWQVILSIMVNLGLIFLGIAGLRKKLPIAFCILYYYLTFSIVSNLLFPIGTNMSERFLFMPSVGFCLAIVLLLYQFLNLKEKRQFSEFYPYFGIVGGIALLFSIKTISRNPVWKDNFTLFTNDINISPNSAKLRNAVGGELLTQALKPGNEQVKNDYILEAIGHLTEAVKIHPLYKNAYLLLGNANSYLEKHEEAIKYYNTALQIDPLYKDAILNQAITYMNMKMPEKSIDNIQQLIRSFPNEKQYRDYLAMAYRDLGRKYGEQQNDLNNALVWLQKSIELNPNDYETLRLMGVANGIAGNNATSIEYFEKALALDPDNADANFNLGTAYYSAGDAQKGEAYHQKAIQIDPEVTKRMSQGGN